MALPDGLMKIYGLIKEYGYDVEIEPTTGLIVVIALLIATIGISVYVLKSNDPAKLVSKIPNTSDRGSGAQ